MRKMRYNFELFGSCELDNCAPALKCINVIRNRFGDHIEVTEFENVWDYILVWEINGSILTTVFFAAHRSCQKPTIAES